jgi:hypothetical protein
MTRRLTAAIQQAVRGNGRWWSRRPGTPGDVDHTKLGPTNPVAPAKQGRSITAQLAALLAITETPQLCTDIASGFVIKSEGYLTIVRLAPDKTHRQQPGSLS